MTKENNQLFDANETQVKSGSKKKKCDFSYLEKELKLTPFALSIIKKRYLLKNAEGEIIETPFEMFHRVAHHIASAEKFYGATHSQIEKIEEEFLRALVHLDFLPNTPTFTGAGTSIGQLSACFVLPVEDSMEGIFEAIKNAALIHKSGGGTGFSFSKIRPKGSRVRTTSGVASGPVSFMKAFDAATETVKQGATRRGANMGVLRVDHPDIEEFIEAKADGKSLPNFNLSVAVTDKFMEAVLQDTNYEIIDPRTQTVVGYKKAREIFDKIVYNAWKTGDPGLIFIDQINRLNPLNHAEIIEATNPCGEQPLPAFGTCNLGHINLAHFVKNKEIDWQGLRQITRLGVRFLDNMLDLSKFPLPEVKEEAQKTRRIGLGIMGFADMLIMLGIPYNSEEALKTAEEVMGFISKEAVKTSEELGKERGNFPLFPGSYYEKEGKKFMRNGTVTSIAPTGTTSIIANVSSGLEPLFAVAFIRRQADMEVLDINPLFEKIAKERGFFSQELMKEVAKRGSIQEMAEIPEDFRRIFVTAHDITPEWHLKMQAAFQKYVDAGISKTINFRNEATVEDVKKAYIMAYKLGLKGITIYRDGSKANQVLSTAKENDHNQNSLQKNNKEESTSHLATISILKNPNFQQNIETAKEEFRIKPRPRPAVVSGTTEEIPTGLGDLYVTINEDAWGPFEVFARIGKSGGEANALTEAVGRLISLALRSGIEIRSIIKHLKGIRGSAPVWQNGELILSVPDAIGKALERFISRKNTLNLNFNLSNNLEGGQNFQKPQPSQIGFNPNFSNQRDNNDPSLNPEKITITSTTQQGIENISKSSFLDSDLCPECGGILEHSSGCVSCNTCGYSKC
jgi:ribonucleoside-diphosphate reductase alpha chain